MKSHHKDIRSQFWDWLQSEDLCWFNLLAELTFPCCDIILSTSKNENVCISLVPIYQQPDFPPETHAVVNGNGSSGDLDLMKQEILREMRKEINKAKQEIIDGEFSWEKKRFPEIKFVSFQWSGPSLPADRLETCAKRGGVSPRCELLKGARELSEWAPE